MDLTLKVWRQDGPDAPGKFQDYTMEGVSPDMSFLEMLDQLNDESIERGLDPIAFDHDCREGICGSCSMVINELPRERWMPQRVSGVARASQPARTHGDVVCGRKNVPPRGVASGRSGTS